MATLISRFKDDEVSAICERFDHQPENLLEILHAAQAVKGYLSADTLTLISQSLNISRADIHGVVSFYHDFRREAGPELEVQVCRGEACQAVGSDVLIDELTKRLKCKLDQPTAELGLKSVFCLGNCALGPAVRINDDIYGRMSATDVVELMTTAQKGCVS